MMLDEVIKRVEEFMAESLFNNEGNVSVFICDIQTLLRAASLLKEVYEQMQNFHLDHMDGSWWDDWLVDAELLIGE